MKQPKLSKGTTGFYNERGEWICTGSKMGRPNFLPEDRQAVVKLQLRRLRFVDGCYDAGGAYWGSPANLYRATGFYTAPGCGEMTVEIFVRANYRHIAKSVIRCDMLPNARFYN